ncbi:hypothetical protein Trydic_g13903 [Trypoxylus dichotomus]
MNVKILCYVLILLTISCLIIEAFPKGGCELYERRMLGCSNCKCVKVHKNYNSWLFKICLLLFTIYLSTNVSNAKDGSDSANNPSYRNTPVSGDPCAVIRVIRVFHCKRCICDGNKICCRACSKLVSCEKIPD